MIFFLDVPEKRAKRPSVIINDHCRNTLPLVKPIETIGRLHTLINLCSDHFFGFPQGVITTTRGYCTPVQYLAVNTLLSSAVSIIAEEDDTSHQIKGDRSEGQLITWISRKLFFC